MSFPVDQQVRHLNLSKVRLLIQLLLLSFLFLSSCEDNEDHNQINYTEIKSGTFFGLCYGYCQTQIDIINKNVIFTVSGWDTTNYPIKTLDGILSNQEWDSLLELIDMDTLLSLDNIIGCPDCADGGGEWIEITKADTIKRVTFEYGMTVEPIQNLIEKVRVIRERFYCEMFPDNC